MTAISARDQERALGLARAAIEQHVLANRPPAETGELRVSVAGVFVSLHVGDALRGCLGTVAPEALGPAVQRMAVAAASRDLRFDPVAAAELGQLHIEISVLSAPEPIDDPGQITIGVHGLSIDAGDRRGLLLPQVASERGMSADQFVDAVCRKAGVERPELDGPDVVLARFRAEVFGDREARPASEN